MKRSSGLDFSDSDRFPAAMTDHPDIVIDPMTGPSHLQRNKTERRRLQGLMRVDGPRQVERVTYSPRNLRDKWNHWMVNEGGKRLFFFLWIFLQLLVAVFGFANYKLKDNLNTARATFGITYRKFKLGGHSEAYFQYFIYLFIFFPAIARMAALVLHVLVVFILLPVCRNFISIFRRTPLNSYIPFDKNITFHKAVAWSIVFWTLVHILAHMVNFARLAKADPDATTTGQRFVVFLEANFATGPGATGWIMTVCLGLMVWYAMEKRRRAHFERFWYSHHLFLPFFLCWQLHGMFCMIKPDRAPFCSWNTIGVFWVRNFYVNETFVMLNYILEVLVSRRVNLHL